MSRRKKPKDDRTRRPLIVGSIIAASLAGLVLAAALSNRRPLGQPSESREKPASREVHHRPAPARPVPKYQTPKAPPTQVVEAPILAEAMDHSNVRTMVRTLMKAAATKDTRLKDTMIRGIKRYGTTARPVIDEQLAVATDPDIKRALQEAWEQAR